MKWKLKKLLVVPFQPAAIHDSKTTQKTNFLNLILQSPGRGNTKISNDPAYITSNVMPPTLKLSPGPDLHTDFSLTAQLSSEKFPFKRQLTSLYVVSTPCKFQLNPNRSKNQHIFYASEEIAPFGYWTANNQKVFTLQMNFLRASVFDLHTDYSKTNFQSVKKKGPSSFFQTFSSFKIESSPLHFYFIYSIVCLLHLQLARCEVMTL